VALYWVHIWDGETLLSLLGAVVALRDVIVLTGRGCGMVVVFFNLTARSSDLVPHKHSFL